MGRSSVALNLALDREVITERLLGMGQTPSYWFVPRTIASPTSASLDFHDQGMDSRRARARELLDQAGYGPDRPLELELSYNTLEDHKKIAVAAQHHGQHRDLA